MICPSAGGALTKNYLTIKEASTVCDISPSSIARGVREGTFPPKIKSNPSKKGGEVRSMNVHI